MSYSKLLYAAGFMLLLSSCQEVRHGKGEKLISELQWIEGNWEMQMPEGTLREQWAKVDDTVWKGYGYMTAGPAADTVFEEFIELKQTGTDVYYLPTIADQNDGKPVPFKAKSISKDEAVFENKEHDFPQRITYKRLSDTTMSAAIEGKENGKEKREEFQFVKR